MKRILILIASFMLVLLCGGCSKPDPERIYKDAIEKMAGLESYTTNMNIEMTYDIDGSKVIISAMSQVERSGENLHMLAEASALTTTKTIEGWLIDGICYSGSNGSYATVSASVSDFDYTEMNLKSLNIDSYGYNNLDGKDVVTLTASDESIKEILYDTMYMYLGTTDFVGFSFSPFEVTVSKDGYIEQIKTVLNVANEKASAVIDLIVTYSGYNSTTVSEPDYTLWENNAAASDNEYVPSVDIEFDITKDDEAKLIEAGYTAYADGCYVNADGTVELDTRYKVLYFMDGDLYAEYDWEYQTGYTSDSNDNYCYFYFSDDSADEGCTDEMIGLLNSTHDIFMDLYYSIH